MKKDDLIDHVESGKLLCFDKGFVDLLLDSKFFFQRAHFYFYSSISISVCSLFTRLPLPEALVLLCNDKDGNYFRS